RAGNRVLPDVLVVRERLHVLGGFVLVLSILEQTRAGGPEDGRTLATTSLRQRPKRQLRRIRPGRREPQWRVLVLHEIGGLLRGECILVRGVVHTGVRGARVQHVRRRQVLQLLHDLQRLQRAL